MIIPFKSDSEFQGEMQISTVIDEMIKEKEEKTDENDNY